MAYEVLSDPGRRREYDMGLGIASAAAPLLPFPSQPASRPAADEAGPVDAPAAPAPPAVPVLPDQVTGQELRRIRESRGISLREIAQISKIGVRFFEYIEDDRVALLPAPVYLRGFLMEYGRALGLDPRRTADAYMANLPPRKA
jgi:curved DNA-binding protein CbpA